MQLINETEPPIHITKNMSTLEENSANGDTKIKKNDILIANKENSPEGDVLSPNLDNKVTNRQDIDISCKTVNVDEAENDKLLLENINGNANKINEYDKSKSIVEEQINNIDIKAKETGDSVNKISEVNSEKLENIKEANFKTAEISVPITEPQSMNNDTNSGSTTVNGLTNIDVENNLKNVILETDETNEDISKRKKLESIGQSEPASEDTCISINSNADVPPKLEKAITNDARAKNDDLNYAHKSADIDGTPETTTLATVVNREPKNTGDEELNLENFNIINEIDLILCENSNTKKFKYSPVTESETKKHIIGEVIKIPSAGAKVAEKHTPGNKDLIEDVVMHEDTNAANIKNMETENCHNTEERCKLGDIKEAIDDEISNMHITNKEIQTNITTERNCSFKSEITAEVVTIDSETKTTSVDSSAADEIIDITMYEKIDTVTEDKDNIALEVEMMPATETVLDVSMEKDIINIKDTTIEEQTLNFSNTNAEDLIIEETKEESNIKHEDKIKLNKQPVSVEDLDIVSSKNDGLQNEVKKNPIQSSQNNEKEVTKKKSTESSKSLLPCNEKDTKAIDVADASKPLAVVVASKENDVVVPTETSTVKSTIVKNSELTTIVLEDTNTLSDTEMMADNVDLTHTEVKTSKQLSDVSVGVDELKVPATQETAEAKKTDHNLKSPSKELNDKKEENDNSEVMLVEDNVAMEIDVEIDDESKNNQNSELKTDTEDNKQEDTQNDLDEEDIITIVNDKSESNVAEQKQDNIEIVDEDDVKIVEETNDQPQNQPQEKVNAEKEKSPEKNKSRPIVCKLSNTLDILSDDDDIMVIEDSNSKENDAEDTAQVLTDKSETGTESITSAQSTDKPDNDTENIIETTTKVDEKDPEADNLPNDAPGDKKTPEENSTEQVKAKKPLLPQNFTQTTKKNLAEMTREELEDFCILKIVEGIADRSNLGEVKTKLKEFSETLETYRNKTKYLAKQCRDLQVVLKSLQEVQKNNPKPNVNPLKITRSVGMQVVLGDKADGRRKGLIMPQGSNGVVGRPPKQAAQANPRPQKPAQAMNIPVPRLVPANSPGKSMASAPANNTIRLVQPNATTGRSPTPVQKAPEKRPHNKISSSVTVDLTDDEPPVKVTSKNSPVPPVRLVSPQNLMAQQRPFIQPLNSPRKVYIPISGPQGQPIRPGQTLMLRNVSPGVRQRMPGMARLQPNPRMSKPLVSRHPAPLPDAMKQYTPATWKPLPPAPDLKLSKVENGIVISWKIEGHLESSYETIASYQLYAYQETTSPPSTALWKKIGDVKALPLPMACTLTQFMAGFKYYFAVRAVDIRSRLGPFSLPGSILLINKV